LAATVVETIDQNIGNRMVVDLHMAINNIALLLLEAVHNFLPIPMPK
jgi:hypothetical protein